MTTAIIIISLIMLSAVYVLAYRAWKKRNWWAWNGRYLQSRKRERMSDLQVLCEKHHKDVTR